MAEKTEDKIPMEKVKKLIEQPVDGLLYDLNMLPEVLATHDKVNSKQWLVMKVIKALKEEVDNASSRDNELTERLNEIEEKLPNHETEAEARRDPEGAKLSALHASYKMVIEDLN